MTTNSQYKPLTSRSAGELMKLVRKAEISPVEIIRASLDRIDEINPRLNAFTDIYRDEALALAKIAEASMRSGETLGPLHGVPVAIKDLTPVKDKRTTLGSHAFAGNVADRDAWIVGALRRAGAIVIGKTATPEFAYSSFTQSPLFGVTRNPWNPSRTPGGSSGGSAAAVAAGAVPLAEGTDMGGSVRIPAAACGIVGLKPSLGRIPLDILPSTFDNISHFGPLARSCADAALFVAATQGPDDCDIQSSPHPFIFDGSLASDPRGLRLALSMDFGFYAVDPEVERNTLHVVDQLRQAGVVVEEVELGWTKQILSVWMDYWRVFMAAYFEDAYETHADRLDPAVRRLIEQGRKISAVHYKRLEIERSRFWDSLRPIFRNFAGLLCPTNAIPAPPADRSDRDFGATDEKGRFHGFDMTAPFNLVGQCPALSVPSGLTRDGLPTGIQIVGRRFDDLGTLKIGALIESLLPPLPLPLS